MYYLVSPKTLGKAKMYRKIRIFDIPYLSPPFIPLYHKNILKTFHFPIDFTPYKTYNKAIR